jgi:hypothetical protein
MSDDIDLLPISKAETLDPAEAARVKPYATLAQAEPAKQGFLDANKKYIWIVVAFFFLSIPYVDTLLTNLTGNPWFGLLLKTILFVVFVVVIMKVT